MKNDKTNKKPRKVKNYLSSLCKWAKYNIKKIIAFLGCLFLMLGMCLSSCKGSKSAKASQILTESNIAFMLNPMPNGYVQNGSTYYAYNYPIVVIPYEDSIDLYVTNNLGHYINVSLVSNITDNNIVEYSAVAPSLWAFYSSSAGVSTRSLGSSVNVSITIDYNLLGLYETHSPIEAIRLIAFDRPLYYGRTMTGLLQYEFADDDSNVYMDVIFDNINTSGVTKLGQFGFNYIEFNYVDEGLFDFWYNEGLEDGYIQGETAGYDKGYLRGEEDGYEDGYVNGHDEGYEQGYLVGLDEGSGFKSPFNVLTTSIDDLFSITVFGQISIGDILRIGFACVLLGFLIKIFLGG